MQTIIKIRLVGFCLLLLYGVRTNANNLNISNISVPSANTISFDIAWDNSWYATAPSNNWDAVWVFVKTQVCGIGSNPWAHSNLSTVSGDHSITGGVLQIDAVPDGKGVFIRRGSIGAGNISTSTVTLTFSSSYTVAATNYEVVGIEMVYVPQGSFQVGDGSTNNTLHSANSFGTGNSSTPYVITGEGAIGTYGMRNDKPGDANITAHSAIIAAFPKGYNGFYCMKYEISQQQYVTFLNLIEFGQQINRTAVMPSSARGTPALVATAGLNRNGIKIDTAGIPYSTPAVYGLDLNNNNVFNEAGDGGNIACNFLSWEDLKAYLDWAALRPMTELEFEKAARGPNASVLTEFPWGSTTITATASSAAVNAGQPSEIAGVTGDGLCNATNGSSTTLGPMRTGFAATSATTRATAGASFYGVMDMGGNVWEQAFQCGYYSGGGQSIPVFNGTLGDGLIDDAGNANAPTWGAVNLSIVRGGNWEYADDRMQVSDRYYVNNTSENSVRTRRTGGRGVR